MPAAGGSAAWRSGALALAFAVPFSLYLATLAPTVTLEDSGELIAAATTLGVPHSPGYPLFALAGKLFGSLPLGDDVAFRLNLMSAFCSALAALLVAWTTGLVLEVCTASHGPPRAADGVDTWVSALAAGLWFATAFEVWEQAIITEVYALNLAVVTAFFLLLARCWREVSPASSARFSALCFLAGLAPLAHPTSFILVPLLALHLARNERGRLSPRRLSHGAAAFVAGLLPVLYLPLASLRDPAADWGDPETPARLFRTLFVSPLKWHDPPAPADLIGRVAAGGELLVEQWAPAILVLALAGLVATHRTNRNFFVHCAAFLVLAGPVVAVATNIDVTAADARVRAENLAQVSVFYLPAYAMVAILIGIGSGFVVRLAARSSAARGIVLAGVVLLPLAGVPAAFRRLDMSDYRLAQDYAENVFAVARPGGLVLADWDPFYFPLVYYQVVEGRRPDLAVLDLQLLRAEWYLERFQRDHADLADRARPQIRAFLDSVRAGDVGTSRARFLEMLQALVEGSLRNGREVYLTHVPRAPFAAYYHQSVVAARRLSREPVGGDALVAIDEGALRFRGLLEGPPVRDRFGPVFGDYYGELFYERAATLERSAEFPRALELYRRVRRLLRADHPLRAESDSQIARLERQLARRLDAAAGSP